MFYPETLFVKILVPEKPYLTREKSMIEIPAVKGPYLILPQRAPTIKMMKTGVLRLFENPEQEPDIYFVQKGIVKVRNNGCTILTKRIIALKDADKVALDNEINQLKTQLDKADENNAVEKSQTLVKKELLEFLGMVAGYLDTHPV